MISKILALCNEDELEAALKGKIEVQVEGDWYKYVGAGMMKATAGAAVVDVPLRKVKAVRVVTPIAAINHPAQASSAPATTSETIVGKKPLFKV